MAEAEKGAPKAKEAKATRLDHGFRVSSVGDQCQSQRTSAPHHTISRTSRQHREAMYLSDSHVRTAKIGRAGADLKYNIKGTLGGQAVTFPKAEAHNLQLGKSEGLHGGVYSNDELGVTVDSQYAKYERDPTVLIGTEGRFRLKDAELIRTHNQAFYGRASPGPASQGPAHGPKYDYVKERQAPARPFGQKLKTDWLKISDAPDKVAPNSYERKDVSIGKQHLTHRENQPTHLFPLGPKFPKSRNADAVSKLDVARSAFGKQTLGKNRSEQTVGFGKGTRDGRSRSAMCMTNSDMGPKSAMPKFSASMPRLPMESHVMRGGFG